MGGMSAADHHYGTIAPATASAEVDLGAFRANIAAIAELVAPAAVMMVVKADAYGHGMQACARAAREAGVQWLGVAAGGEALALREAGDTGRIFCWLYGPDEDMAPLVASDIDVSAQTPEQVNAVVMAASVAECTARVHLKIDTGLSRNGASPDTWPEVVEAAAEAVEAGAIEVVGVWSHFACADEIGHPANTAQLDVFNWAVRVAREAGLAVPVRHIANSAAALTMPEARFEMVRLGIAGYGIDPADGTIAADAGVDLVPVMTLRAQLALVKHVPAGAAVSYGQRWSAPTGTVLGLVPLGYADGIPRAASGKVEVRVNGRRVPQRGSICMDQFVVDLGPDATDAVGDEVVLFGAPAVGAGVGEVEVPTASQWAGACGTIGYEVVTRVGVRVPRVHRA